MDGNNNNQNQDYSFWEEIYERFKKQLLCFALRLVNGVTCDAQDLVQETMCRALLYSKNPQEITHPLGYLRRIMRRIWITKWRKENTHNMFSLDELLSQEDEERRAKMVEPAVDPDVQRILEYKELQEQFRAMRGPLKAREDLLLKLHLDGYTCDEIAEVLDEDSRLINSDLNAVRTKVRTRIRKALEKLREGQS